MTWNEDLRLAEAQRWQGLVQVAFRILPELQAWLTESEVDIVDPGAIWIQLVDELLDADYHPLMLDTDVWPRALGLVEVVEEAIESLLVSPSP